MELIENIEHSYLETELNEVKDTFPFKKKYLLYKRVFDIFLLFILSPLILSLITLIALLIKLSSRGPIFFNHVRIGKNGKKFKCYKFRTMIENASILKSELLHLNEMSGPAFKMKCDPRITKFGKFLRKSSLDELPQMFNILKGNMSFVGPRPPLPEEVIQYTPWQKTRLSTIPGLTCIWQISGRNNIQDFDEWVKMDIEYINNASLKNDIKIILKTIPVVLFKDGAY